MRVRRVVSVLACGLLATACAPSRAATRAAAPYEAGVAPRRLVLPAPSGAFPVGTVALHLVDRARRDPWVPKRPRELMVSVLYPARDVARHPVAPQMGRNAAGHFDTSLGTPVHQGWGIKPGTVDWAATPTHAHEGAPAAEGRRPVVLYSPGLGDPRTLGTTACEDLASRGYVVVSVDHTYDASEVEFPGGRVEPFALPLSGDPLATLRKAMDARVADTRFVLDSLTALADGHDPDAEGRTLPQGLAAAVDTHAMGMFGQSAGGFTALETMRIDPRLTAAADLDGTVGFDQDDGGPGLSDLAEKGLTRPFLLMGSQASDHHTVRSWESLWARSRGPRYDIHLRGVKHHGFTDLESLVPQLGLPKDAAYEDIGWADPKRAVATQRARLAAFFDRYLRGRKTGSLSAG